MAGSMLINNAHNRIPGKDSKGTCGVGGGGANIFHKYTHTHTHAHAHAHTHSHARTHTHTHSHRHPHTVRGHIANRDLRQRKRAARSGKPVRSITGK